MKLGYYPDVVNENVTRIVASTVVVFGVISIVLPNPYTISLLIFGFLLRVSFGPRYEPFVVFTNRILVPRLKVSFVPVPGPPKRFAQLIGLLFSITSLLFLLQGLSPHFQITMAILVFFASLESFLGWCAGCFVFGLLMKLGVIPQEICERCNNLKFNEE
ncbi:MAG: DUF4395 domain-containing protein [Leptospira sp.]|nr:DUF4395 domain-containing protein [Leptospira sp.]